MGSARLLAAEWLLATRWPGLLGVLLLVAVAGWGVGVTLPAHEQLVATQSQLTAAERTAAAARNGTRLPIQSAAGRREQFYRTLAAQADVAKHIESIYAAAAAERLSLLHGEYTGSELPAAGLVRLRIVLPIKGSYGQVRRFVASALAAVPGLALDDLSLQRQAIGEAQVEARVQLSLFLVKR